MKCSLGRGNYFNTAELFVRLAEHVDYVRIRLSLCLRYEVGISVQIHRRYN